MAIIGIICEYNPFHNGHLYHINKIKEMYPDSIIILVLNGYFLERGEVSIETKEDKTKLALEFGVDIVLELPFIYGTESADTFADTAVKILNNFGAQKVVFGSECNDINKILEIAHHTFNDNYNEEVKRLLDEGLNYPTALAKALHIDFEFTPNDLLGISYTKSIIKNKYNIEPITIKRTNEYHDLKSNDEIISASNIREKLKNNEDITKYLPDKSKNSILNVNESSLFSLIKAKIITDEHLEEYLDVDEGIEYRLKEQILKSNNLKDFIANVKTKRYTYNKINRMLIHILIGLKKCDINNDLAYIKVLGFNQSGKKHLSNLKESSKISTIIDKESVQYKYELKAALIYDLINNTNTYEFEKKAKPIIF